MRTIGGWVDEIHQRDNTIDKLKEENARLREALDCINGFVMAVAKEALKGSEE